ncbi:MAG TPA: indole-3-glycerol-phosphate synthase [Candidatus Thermoplasmatota archaeon]|jgi:indole-3-glycerol phosphate synthase|nr:indole-3-glycerol-phosphate synthase [Candidatus Thermoplasmatota archaeon]
MDLLDEFAARARGTLQRGYYDLMGVQAEAQTPSLVAAVASRPRAILAEIKPASPSEGALRAQALGTAEGLVKAGARGLSVLTEPEVFHGSIQALRGASKLGVPTMMKDFALAEAQLACARRCGARAVLLIASLHARGLADLPMAEMVQRAHGHGLEALVEVASASEFRDAQAAGADLIGINNRDLRNLAMDLQRTPRILAEVTKDRPVVGLSGVHTRADADALFAAGCDAILVGSSLMKAPDPAGKLRELL